MKAPLFPPFFSAFSKYHVQHRLLNYNILKNYNRCENTALSVKFNNSGH